MSLDFLDAFADPVIAARTRQLVGVTALAGGLALLGPRLLPGRARARLAPVARDAFAYGLLGMGARMVVQHHRSRLQMVALLGAVAAVEACRHKAGAPAGPRLARWATGSLAACLGVVAAKWALEPGVLGDTWRHLGAPDGDA